MLNLLKDVLTLAALSAFGFAAWVIMAASVTP